MKYWNKGRVKRRREWEARAKRRSFEESVASYEKSRAYSPGDTKKNVALMLDALGSPVRRKIVCRLQRDGAMSLSKLARPFRLKLTTALSNVLTLERAGIVVTHKQGRVRICTYRRASLHELAAFLGSKHLRF